MKKRVAIIGAGISGLTLARALHEQCEVTVFEKARGVGGRMSTRYADPFYFDHGAQFFTARDASFQRYLSPLIESGLVAPWTGKVITLEAEKAATDRLWFEPHYVAVPNMNSLCKSLAEKLTVLSSVEVAPLTVKASDGWHMEDKNGNSLGVFDWVISTAPPVQTLRLLGHHLPAEHPMHKTRLLGCYTLMIGFNQRWEKSWIGAKIQHSPLEWIAINTTKPGRNKDVTCMVVHTSNAWAEEHIADDMQQAELFLRREFERVTKIDTGSADYFACHRWRYALAENAPASAGFMDDSQGLAATGDWCSSSRIEEAWLNATALAAQLTALAQ